MYHRKDGETNGERKSDLNGSKKIVWYAMVTAIGIVIASALQWIGRVEANITMNEAVITENHARSLENKTSMALMCSRLDRIENKVDRIYEKVK